MNKFLLGAVSLTAALTAIELLGPEEAFARGAASNIMNSPGYQRRLQESRGYVPNQSGSIFAPTSPRAYQRPKVRRRH